MQKRNPLINLSKAREAANLTQQDLADKLNINRVMITYWENGTRTPQIKDLITLCKILNVSSDYILGMNDNPSTNTDLSNITKFTGLNISALGILHFYSPLGEWEKREIINNLICTPNSDLCFEDFLQSALEYKYAIEKENTLNSKVNEIIKEIRITKNLENYRKLLCDLNHINEEIFSHRLDKTDINKLCPGGLTDIDLAAFKMEKILTDIATTSFIKRDSNLDSIFHKVHNTIIELQKIIKSLGDNNADN